MESDDTIQTVITLLALSIGRVLILATGTASENLFLIAFGVTFTYVVSRARGGAIDRAFWLFQAANLGLIFIALVTLYRLDDWHGFRILGPHLFFTLLLLYRRIEKLPLVAIVLLLAASALLGLPKISRDLNLRAEQLIHQDIATYYDLFSQDLRYDASITDRWCHSVAVSVAYFSPDYPLALALPPGSGLSNIILANAQTEPFKAKYLLISDGQQDALTMPVVRLIVSVPGGALYENLQSACS